MKHVPNKAERASARSYWAELNRVLSSEREARGGELDWLTPEVVCAIVSRETWWGNAPGYVPRRSENGAGDRGHGRGLFQIDDRAHGDYITRVPARRFDADLRYVIEHVLIPAWRAFNSVESGAARSDLRLSATLAAYNAGVGGVRKRALALGKHPDAATTGGDYSRDVLALAEFWAFIIEKERW